MKKTMMEELVDQVCGKYAYDDVNLLPILQELQEKSTGNFISEEVAKSVARVLDITESRVYDVITYFSALSSVPRGEFIIQICESTTCSVNRNENLIGWFEDELGIRLGENTKDNKFSLISTHCIGACDISPAVKVNHDVYGNLTREKVRDIIATRRGL